MPGGDCSEAKLTQGFDCFGDDLFRGPGQMYSTQDCVQWDIQSGDQCPLSGLKRTW